MSSAEWTHLGVFTAVVVVYGLAVYAAWWALFKDRSRGRRRCPRCWHDLSHTPGLVCSECGHTARSERQLFRCRRRRGVAALAILACVGMALYINFKLERRGWHEYVPTRALIVLLPFQADTRSGVYEELDRRIARDDLSVSQWSALLGRCAVGDAKATPTDDAWIGKYARLADAWRFKHAADTDIEWDEATLRTAMAIPPRIDLATRAAWPIGVTPQFRFQMREWWPFGPSYRVTVTPQVDDAEPLVFYRRGDFGRPFEAAHSFEVEALRGAEGEVEFLVEVDRADPSDRRGPDGAIERTWQRMTETRAGVALVTEDVALQAVTDEQLTAAVRSTFEAGVVRWPGGGAPIRFYFNPQRTFTQRFNGVAMGVRAELVRGNEVARRLDIWWLAGAGGGTRGFGAESSYDAELVEAFDGSEAWVLRVIGDPGLAMRAGDTDRYWDGTVTIPLKVDEREGPAPPLFRWSEEPPPDL